MRGKEHGSGMKAKNKGERNGTRKYLTSKMRISEVKIKRKRKSPEMKKKRIEKDKIRVTGRSKGTETAKHFF